MIRKISLLFFSTIFIFAQSMDVRSRTDKKIIINLDVNGTIIFGDIAGGRTIEDSAKLALADAYKDVWVQSLTRPISYYDYVKFYLLPGSNSDKDLRAKRTEVSLDFLNFLQKTNHRYYESAKQAYDQMTNKLKLQKASVFNSFYKLIDYLKANNINFSIILRTFGSDLDRVIPEINEKLGYQFFKVRGKFKETKLSYEQPDKKEVELDSLSDIYSFLKNSHNAGIRDDYTYWNSHNEHQEFGKMFPIDTNDIFTISLFFDDNVKTDPASQVNIVNPIDPRTGNHLKVSKLVESKNIVAVNGVQALLDDEYFIKLVQEAIEKNR